MVREFKYRLLDEIDGVPQQASRDAFDIIGVVLDDGSEKWFTQGEWHVIIAHGLGNDHD